ncbi:MAG: TetR/AcrR family transcriptional regulator C-terminal domain-containing protein, partial [Acidimicrobiales bacterium]
MNYSSAEPDRGRRAGGLDRPTILSAAVALVDRDGLCALNMRALARALGAGTMSLYHHVPNKDALLDGITEAVLTEVDIPAAGDGPWAARVVDLATSFRGVCLRHPNCIPLLVTRTFGSETALGPCEAGFGLLAEAGFEPARAVVVFRTIVAYCLGFVTMESGGFFGGLGPNRDPAELRGAGLVRLAELVPHLDGRDFAADFRSGLRILLAGVR